RRGYEVLCFEVRRPIAERKWIDSADLAPAPVRLEEVLAHDGVARLPLLSTCYAPALLLLGFRGPRLAHRVAGSLTPALRICGSPVAEALLDFGLAGPVERLVDRAVEIEVGRFILPGVGIRRFVAVRPACL